MIIKTMPIVRSCSVMECAYNRETACHAGGITVEGPVPLCGTYFRSQRKGGIQETGTVGACKNDGCVYNDSFECTASAIEVSIHYTDRPECDTFTQRRIVKEAWDV